MRKSRVHKPACISIAGMAAEDAQMGSVVASRASAPCSVTPWFGYVANICFVCFTFFFPRAALVWICDPKFVFLVLHVFSVLFTCTYTHTPTFCILYFIRTCMHTDTHTQTQTHTQTHTNTHTNTHKHTQTHTQRNSPYQGCPRCGRRPLL